MALYKRKRQSTESVCLPAGQERRNRNPGYGNGKPGVLLTKLFKDELRRIPETPPLSFCSGMVILIEYRDWNVDLIGVMSAGGKGGGAQSNELCLPHERSTGETQPPTPVGILALEQKKERKKSKQTKPRSGHGTLRPRESTTSGVIHVERSL